MDVLTDRFYRTGTHVLDWDGRDEAGRPLPSGAYLLRLESRDTSQSKKMMLAR